MKINPIKKSYLAPLAVLAISALSANAVTIVTESIVAASYGGLAFDADAVGLSYTASVTEGALQAGFTNFATLSNGAPGGINPGGSDAILFPNDPDPKDVQNTATSFTLDLGAATEIGSITAFSSHTTTRSFLFFDVYGSNTAGLNPGVVGSTLISSVDIGRNDQVNDVVAARISDDGGASLGSYRYLIFDVFMDPGTFSDEHAFITELDVQAVPESSAAILLGLAGLGFIVRRRR